MPFENERLKVGMDRQVISPGKSSVCMCQSIRSQCIMYMLLIACLCKLPVFGLTGVCGLVDCTYIRAFNNLLVYYSIISFNMFVRCLKNKPVNAVRQFRP